ncbi:hypothetical protein M569_07967 [Genlisea aurea]|uniref:MYB-CC type transcription factor LHEQLE-containing domain-containing protein n=1 Tax=Genlisea aurea TaxID=192259 RepID=S8CIF3_9LAMI|nr:hypothetical protein M569_07967 [Genlisea aurea]
MNAEKHVQIRQDAEQRYVAMLEQACRMLADQIIGMGPASIPGGSSDGLFSETWTKNSAPVAAAAALYQSPPSLDELAIARVVPPNLIHRSASDDCATQSCCLLTTSSSPPPPPPPSFIGNRVFANADGPFSWGETPDLCVLRGASQGL